MSRSQQPSWDPAARLLTAAEVLPALAAGGAVVSARSLRRWAQTGLLRPAGVSTSGAPLYRELDVLLAEQRARQARPGAARRHDARVQALAALAAAHPADGHT